MLNIRKISNKLLKLLEGHLALIVLAIFVIVILYAAFIFYNYAYKAVVASPQAFYKEVKLKKAVFERIMEDLESREENISEAMGKEYPDIFR